MNISLPLLHTESATQIEVRDAAGVRLCEIPFSVTRDTASLSADQARQAARLIIRILTRAATPSGAIPLKAQETYRAAIRDSVAWLHERAETMNEAHASAILHSAAYRHIWGDVERHWDRLSETWRTDAPDNWEASWIYGVRIMREGEEWIVYVRDLPEVLTAGYTFREAVASARDAINIVVAERLHHEQALNYPTPIEVGEISLAPRPELVKQLRERWFRRSI